MTEVQDPVLEAVKTHWNSLRAGRLAPFRAEIDPSAFEVALGNMFILERINPGDVRIRLAGMKLCDLMGMEVRGLPLTAFLHDTCRAQLDAIIDVVLNHPATAQLSLTTTDANGKTGPARMLLLPLRSDFGDISRIIGCLSLDGQAFQLPVRMKINDQQVKQIEARRHGATEHPMPGFYEDSEKFRTGGPALRKVVDNRDAISPSRGERPAALRLVHSTRK